MAVKSKRLRFEILKRDGYQCVYCGKNPTQCPLEVDHVVPEAEGGTDDPENLVTACQDCNRGKSDVPLDQKRYAARRSASQVRDHAEQVRAYLEAQRELVSARELALDEVMAYWESHLAEPHYSVRGIVRHAMQDFDIQEILEAIDIVAGRRLNYPKPQVRYFCGILRRKRRRMTWDPEALAAIEAAERCGARDFSFAKDKDGVWHMRWTGAKLPEQVIDGLREHFETIRSHLGKDRS